MSIETYPQVATATYPMAHSDTYVMTMPTMTCAADYRDFGKGLGKWVALSADGIVRCAFRRQLETVEYADKVNAGPIEHPITEVKWVKGL